MPLRRTSVVLLVLVQALCLYAQDESAEPEPDPENPLRSDRIGKAWTRSQDEIDDACQDYLRQLQEAVREEMLENNLEEANRIAAEIRFLEWKLGSNPEGSDPKKMPDPPAREPEFDNDRAKRARKRVEKRIEAIYKEYVKALHRARRKAMRSFELELANTIQDEIKRIELKIGVPKRFKIDANDARWQETVEVHRGEIVTVYARGRWSYGPGIAPHGPHGNRGEWVKHQGRYPGELRGLVPGRLIGKLGNSMYAIGDKLTIKINRDDTLTFRMEDKFHNDNRGKMELAIVVCKEDDSIFLPD